jgi:hypothetical protein
MNTDCVNAFHRALAILVGIVTSACVSSCGIDQIKPPNQQPQVIDSAPSWSHASGEVAFQRLRASTYGPPGLYIINSKGVGIPRLLSPNPGRDLAFSPNGKSLALVRGGSIVIVDCLSGSERTVLFTPIGRPTVAAWCIRETGSIRANQKTPPGYIFSTWLPE